MSGDYEAFSHEVDPWTVGRLRESLEGVPDDWPVTVFVAEEPGGMWVSEQVVIDADGAEWLNGRGQVTGEFFGIGCEFPSGSYYRPT